MCIFQEIKNVAAKLDLAEPVIYRGEELKQRGFGGRWGTSEGNAISISI